MGTIIDAILKIFPLASWLEQKGLNKEAAAGLSVLILFVLFWLATYYGKMLAQWVINSRTAKDLKPQFDYQMVRNATRIYIPTQYQNASPTRQEEPGFTHQYVARNPLIPFFIKTAFNEKTDGERFYLILADSGMGKTTFMLNLYVRYFSPFNRHRKYKMRLFRFSHPDTMAEIKAIPKEEVKNTILLLDALDEDPNIVSKNPDVTDAEAFQNRVDEIIEVTRNFCEVVMTCRTQYFPGQEDNPYELNVRRPDEKGFYILNKLYISPFTDREVKQYLNKKFGFLRPWNNAKKVRAGRVVSQSRHLIMRPMMLSYIDYLVDDNRTFHSQYDIYETLIEKWLLREAEKRKHIPDREKFINDLRRVSQQTGVAIYETWKQGRRMYLTKEEAVGIAEQNQIDLKPEEVTGQSLLTCDGAGNWKFAHKSIMEFFLAKEIMEDFKRYKAFHFTGMDMARRFCRDRGLPELLLIKGGKFLMGSPPDEADRGEDETQHPVEVSDFYMSAYTVTLGLFELFIKESNYQTDADKDGGSFMWNGKEWKKKAGINWRCDEKGALQTDKEHPVIHVSWNDANVYCEWLSRKLQVTFRLPTEVEWEYACRAGTDTPFHTGNNLTTDEANYNGNFPYSGNPKGRFLNKTTPTGSYPPNAWGLYDMHGNVFEWCCDWYGKDYYDQCKKTGTVKDPVGPEQGGNRVIRGGSWNIVARGCRAAYRNYYAPGYRNYDIGFRLVGPL